ncbi:hypothetical protein ACLQ3K_22075 [Tsukamurella sp. DT100]|uniref:hypothetical protein n=1 Tax=Tsukamurella sp. DT100 TaxID=3393415 RepID=UPI003CF3B8E0
MTNTNNLDPQALARKSLKAVELEERQEQIRQLSAGLPEPEPSPDEEDEGPTDEDLVDSHIARNGNRRARRAATRRLARRHR